MINELEIELAGYPLRLSSSKSAFDPNTKILYIADLHAGKSATLRAHGIPVPEALLLEDLLRIGSLIEFYEPSELIVLGDFFHARTGKKDEVFDLLHNFRNSYHETPMCVIIGNHDRSTGALPEALRITFEPENSIRGQYTLLHFPEDEPSRRILCGHLHPGFRLPSVGTIPCFVKHGSQLILPSFGSSTGCSVVAADESKEFFLVADGGIFAI